MIIKELRTNVTFLYPHFVAYLHQSFLKILKSAKNYKGEVIIGGDHNLDLLKADRHKQTQCMLENILANELLPCITRLTRITKSSAALIDNIITS